MKNIASSDRFLRDLFFDVEGGGNMLTLKRLTFNGLYGVMSQKMELFIQ